MKATSTQPKQIFYILAAFLCWATILLQLYLIIVNRTVPVADTLIRFLSYFTVLTNTLVALCFSSVAITKPAGPYFFSRFSVTSAVTVYIVVVGLVYNILLRQLWSPTGLQKIVDELLHSFIPLLFVIHWLTFSPKTKLQWQSVISWLIYPLVYTILILVAGNISRFYPYPFIDVNELGYQLVIINSLAMCLGFLILSLLLIVISKTLFKIRGPRILH